MGTLVRVLERLPKVGFCARITTSATGLGQKRNEVKRPASPFALFYQENSKTFKMQNPEVSQQELMRVASNEWKSSAPYEQQRYKDLYDVKLSEYKQTIIEPPKRPVNGYIRFYMDNFESLSVIYPSVLDRSKKSGEMWKSLSEYERSQYQMAYSKELAEFYESLTEEDKEAIQTKKDALNLRRQRQNIRKYGKEAWRERPKVTSVNPYKEYIRDQSPNVPKGENTFIYLSKSWKQLGETEKAKYREMAAQNAEQSRKEFSEWEARNSGA